MYPNTPIHRSKSRLPIVGVLAFAGIVSTAFLPANAQLRTDLNFQAPDMGTTGNREAGAQRNDTCVDASQTSGMMALVPDTNIGLTSEASPDLFAYIPPNKAEKAELRIFNEATGAQVYAGEFTLPENSASADYPYGASVVRFPLSGTSVRLNAGEPHIWAVFVVCDTANRAQDMVVDVTVQRADESYVNTLSADIKAQLDTIETASSEDKVLTYGSAGLWYDLLSELSSDPATYSEVWADLLIDQGMEAIADVPVFTTTFSPIKP